MPRTASAYARDHAINRIGVLFAALIEERLGRRPEAVRGHSPAAYPIPAKSLVQGALIHLFGP